VTKTEKNKHARQVSVSRVTRETPGAKADSVRRTVTARRRTEEPEAVQTAEQGILPTEHPTEETEAFAPEETEQSPALAPEEYTEEIALPVCDEESENGKSSAQSDEKPLPSDDDIDEEPEGLPPDTSDKTSLTEDLLDMCSCPEDIPEEDPAREEEPQEPLAVLTEEDIYADLAKDEQMKAEKMAASRPEAGKWYIPQQWNEISIPRRVIMVLCAALFVFSCLPLFIGVITPGVLPPACIALFFFGCALYWPKIEGCRSLWGNVLIAVVAVCVLAGVTYMACVSGKLISASGNTLADNTNEVTVVVLGCKVNGDRPSRMLQARLEKAAEFLLEHPQAHCIVTGGKGPDEDYPEALIMKNYLVNKGISSMRIIMEDTSTSTLENLTNASQLAKRYNCHERFLIVTDRFHQYRAITVANSLGMVSYALNVDTVWYLAMQYWFREIAAITRDWLVA